jgi:DNA polymerase I-like protein with 3'-5' exonuclease and polymerase domains
MRYQYINQTEEAEKVVQALLNEELLAFDIETQPAFRYPRQKRTKKEYLEYFTYLKHNRWGLSYNPSLDEITDPLPPPAPLAERLRLYELLEAERNNVLCARSSKAQARRIAELEDALAAMSDATAPDWVLLHIVRIIKEEQFANDPVRPGLDPRSSRVFLVQFGTRDRMNYCFNVVRIGMEVLKPIFERVPLLGANLTFDVQFLLHNLKLFPRVAWDVIVADRVMTLGLNVEHHLADVAERWIKEKLNKTVRETFLQPFQLEATDQQVRYACTDVDILFPIYERQRQYAAASNQLEAVELFVSLTNPTAAIEYCGFKIDTARWLELASEAERREQQAAEALAGFLNVSVDDLTKRAVVLEAANAKGIAIDTLDRVERDEARKEYENDERGKFFELYDRWAHWQKRVTTYGRSFLSHIHPQTGRIHPRLKIAGTDTGRFACSEPNLLNIPRGEGDDLDFRSAFVAPEGYVFANADYAAMEQRIAADLSEDPALLSLFRAGGDNHSVTAALMFHIKRGDVAEPQPATLTFQHQQIEGYIVPSRWDAQATVQFVLQSGLAETISKKYKKTTRQIAKVVAFLYFYGGTYVGLARKLHIPVAEAEQFFRDFKAVYPVLSRWFADNAEAPFQQRATRADGSSVGYIATYAGLRRWFELPRLGANSAEVWKQRGAIQRQAMNHPCQGGNAVIMARAMVSALVLGQQREGEIEAQLGIERMIVAPIYDEALAIVPATLAEAEAQRWLEQVLLNAAHQYMRHCPAAVEANPVSKEWRKY